MSFIAPILDRIQGKVQFCIDNVEPNREPLLSKTAQSQIRKILGGSVLAFSHDYAFRVIKGSGIHPLALAVHNAFSEHRPLSLTPDTIWVILLQKYLHCWMKIRGNFH
jgi:hypothetical protein